MKKYFLANINYKIKNISGTFSDLHLVFASNKETADSAVRDFANSNYANISEILAVVIKDTIIGH